VPVDRLAVEEAPRREVHGHHVPGAQAPAVQHAIVLHVEHAHLGCDEDEAIGGHHGTRGPEAVAVQGRAHQPPVGEDEQRGPVPRLHQAGLVLEEGAHLGGQVGVVLPRRRHEQRHRVRRVAPGEREEGESLVEGGRIAPAFGEQRA